MTPISYRYCHFPPVIIQQMVWLYARLTLSFRDIVELLADGGIHENRRKVAKGGAGASDGERHRRQSLNMPRLCKVAERVGFEPTDPCESHDFES